MASRQNRRDVNLSVGGGGSAALAFSAGMNELSQLALWMAANLAGMVSAVLSARAPFFRSLMHRVGILSSMPASAGKRRALRRPAREESLPMLAEAIVGSSKSEVASVFGPPRSAVVMNAVGGADFWQAETWYYPMPKSGPLAMAIHFAGDDAKHVDFLRAPEV